MKAEDSSPNAPMPDAPMVKTPVTAVIFTRVSKKDQKYTRQVADLEGYAQKMGWQVVALIAEKITGVRSNQEREGIGKLLEMCQSGQVQKVLTTEVTRLGRRPSQTHLILETLTELKVSIYVGQFNIETLLSNGKLNPAASMIFAIMADAARQERETMIDRIVSGMAEAKRKGKTFGRKPGRLYSDEDLRKKYAKPLRDLQQGLSIRKVAKLYDLSADTVQRIKKLMAPQLTVVVSQSLESQGTQVKSLATQTENPIQLLEVSLWLRVENNSKFVRGKSKVRRQIEDWVLSRYQMHKPDPSGWNYTLQIPYQSEAELEKIMDEILMESNSLADSRHCFIECDMRALDGSERYW